MQTELFLKLIESLTGTSVKSLPSDINLLTRILGDDSKAIDHSEFNELLLVVNKDRISKPFFDRFFGAGCTIAALQGCVANFQASAMLRYGNFIFAFRTLSRIETDDGLCRELGPLYIDRTDAFDKRPLCLIDIDSIPRDDTSLVGYLSTAQIVGELDSCLLLKLACDGADPSSDLTTLRKATEELSKPDARQGLLSIIEKFKEKNPNSRVVDFREFLKSAAGTIQVRHDRMREVQAIAIRNQDIYLTWDHMDVYFATSMRKPWEFLDLYDFVHELMKSTELSKLPIRYFDPTQSYTAERVDKGLVESLMLKRAKCTVYSVQDTDTLGKDSELAATLAQGKPVIAYVPLIEPSKRVEELLENDPTALLDRLRFVLYADERFMSELNADDANFVEGFKELNSFTRSIIFRSIPDQTLIEAFIKRFQVELRRLANIVATSEQRIYERRANTLKKSHPLGIQVNLTTGVTNGVLVVRTIADCAKLLKSILSNTMSFDIEDEKSFYCLKEQISGSIFRVVTKNKKVNNCFWNFYLR